MSRSEIKGRVLIIDDEEKWRKRIAQILKLRGFVSVEATDLMTAMDALANEKFDIATIDMQFEEASDALGETLLEFIRIEYPAIACIMISGSVESFGRVDDLKDEQGLGAFIHKKELTPNQLEKAINRAKKVAEQAQLHTLKDDTLQKYQQCVPRLELTLAGRKSTLSQIQNNLAEAQNQAAKYGMAVPVRILNEIEEYKKSIIEAENDIERLKSEISETKRKISELEKEQWS